MSGQPTKLQLIRRMAIFVRALQWAATTLDTPAHRVVCNGENRCPVHQALALKEWIWNREEHRS